MTERIFSFLFIFACFWGVGTSVSHSQEFFLELKGVLEAEDGPIRVYIEVGEKGQARQSVKLQRDGSFFIELDLNMDYEFYVRADGYQPQLVKLNTRTSDETIEAGLKPLDFNIYLAKIPQKVLAEQAEKEERGEEKEEIAPLVSNVVYNKETGQFAFKQEYMKSVEGQKQAAVERKVQQIAQVEQAKQAQAAQNETQAKSKAELAAANAEKVRLQEEARIEEKRKQEALEVARRAEQAQRDAQMAELARQRTLDAQKEKARLDSIQAATRRAQEQEAARKRDADIAQAEAKALQIEQARLQVQRFKDSVDNARIREQARIDSLIAAKAEEKRLREEREKARLEILAQAKAEETRKQKQEEDARKAAERIEIARKDSTARAMLEQKTAQEQLQARRQKSMADSLAWAKEQRALQALEAQRKADQLAAKQNDSILAAQRERARAEAAERAQREQQNQLRQDSLQNAQREALRRIEEEQAKEALQEKKRQDSLLQERIEQKRREDEARRQQVLITQVRQDSIQQAAVLAQQARDKAYRQEQREKASQDSIRQLQLAQLKKEEQENQALNPKQNRIIDNNIRIFKTPEERSEVVAVSERAALISRLVVTLKKYDEEELETSDAFGFINFGDGSGNIELNEREFYRYRRLFYR